MNAEQTQKCTELLDHFVNEENTEPFLERVNWEELGLYDYLQIVKTPMDLGTIRTRLENDEYKKPAEFAKDMRLVWDNCKLYNQDGSDLYMLAEELSKRFEEKVKAMKLDVGGPSRADRSIPAPTVDEKIAFSRNLYKIPATALGEVVNALNERCAKCLDKTSSDEMDIVIDSIDNKTFREVEKMIVERLPEGEKAATPRASKKSKRSSKESSEPALKKTKVEDEEA